MQLCCMYFLYVNEVFLPPEVAQVCSEFNMQGNMGLSELRLTPTIHTDSSLSRVQFLSIGEVSLYQ